MAQQRLYTEEQVREMLSMTDMIFDNDLMPHKDIISCFTPIELPSDEESFNESIRIMEEWYGSGCTEEIDAHFRGAKWMRDKIKGGNK